MLKVLALYRSSVGKKAVMAVTGVILFLFVVMHMLGNLKVFQGPEKFTAYAEFLRTVGAPLLGRGQLLLIVRVGLLVSVLLHITAAIQLFFMAKNARPVEYRRPVHLEDTYASRTMRWGGVIIFAFVIYHLLHFTFGTVHPDFVQGSPYDNIVAGFQSVPVSVMYIIAVGVLGLHLYHGIWSGLQTFGVNHPQYNRLYRGFAALMSLGIFAGYIGVPIAVMTGVLR